MTRAWQLLSFILALADANFLFAAPVDLNPNATPVGPENCFLELLPPHYAHVRYPEEPVRDLPLLRKLIEQSDRAMSEVFIPAVESGALEQNYGDVISAQHRILNEGYNGFLENAAGNTHGRPPAWPGEYVTVEGMWAKGYKKANTIGFIRFDPLALPAAKMEMRDFAEEFDQWRVKTYTVEIPHIPEAQRPYNIWDGVDQPYVRHFYPSPEHYRLYRWRASELMKNLVHPPDPRYRIWYLAEYYHLFINAHFFYTANNSLAMSHVNYFLKRWGMNPIPHGNLDFRATKARKFATFRDFFVAWVREYNRGADFPEPSL